MRKLCDDFRMFLECVFTGFEMVFNDFGVEEFQRFCKGFGFALEGLKGWLFKGVARFWLDFCRGFATAPCWRCAAARLRGEEGQPATFQVVPQSEHLGTLRPRTGDLECAKL